MANLFRINPQQVGLQSSGPLQTNPRLMQGPSVGIQAPQFASPQSIQPVQIQPPRRPPETVDPIASIIDAGLNFGQLYFERAGNLKDEEDRLNASRKFRAAEDELRLLRDGDENNVGYLQLHDYEAMDKRKEYMGRIDYIINKYSDMVKDKPNEKRHLMNALLGLQSNYRSEFSSSFRLAREQVKGLEREAQYGAFLQRIDDYIDKPQNGMNMGAVMAEISAYTNGLGPEKMTTMRSKIFRDVADAFSSRDPRQAGPLLEQFKNMAEPVLDLESRTYLNNAIVMAAHNATAIRNREEDQLSRQRSQTREENANTLYGLVHDPDVDKPIDWDEWDRMAEMGLVARSVVEQYKTYYYNEQYYTPSTPEQVSDWRMQILQGKISEDDIKGLELRRNEKTELLRLYQDVWRTEHADDRRNYANYVEGMIDAHDQFLSSRFKSSGAVIRNNAVKLYLDLMRNPNNPKSAFETAKDVLRVYGVDLDSEDLKNIPGIPIPGKEIYRPITIEEGKKTLEDLLQAKKDGLISDYQWSIYNDILTTRKRIIEANAVKEAEMLRKQQEGQQVKEKGLTEQAWEGFTNWVGTWGETDMERLARQRKEKESEPQK